MFRLMASVVIVSVVSVGSAVYLQERTVDGAKEAAPVQNTSVRQESRKTVAKRNEPLLGRMARLKMDSRGHFVTKAKMNGRSIEVLVDTGATSVAISNKTARRLGINLNQSDFKHRVSTANGIVKAASATIDKIQIGRVTVRNVRAAVVQGDGLGGTLLGMSFLGQLREFKIKNGELIMRQ